MKTEYLPCFFLLATDGIWLISTNRWKSILPIVERIEHPPQVAYSIGIESRLRGLGNTIGLDTLGAQLCMQSRYSTGKTVTLKTLEESSSEDKGPRTGKMIACFLTLEDAQKALKKMKITDPLQRWQNETVEVLKAIGENHPVFIVTREGKFQFPLDFYEDANIRTNSCPVIDAALFNSFFDTPSVNADAATPESNPSKGFPKKYQRENPVADNSLRELIRERFEGSLPDIAALIAAGRITVAAPLAPHSQGSRIVRGPRGPYVRQLPVASPSPVSPVTAPVQATTKAAYVRIEGIEYLPMTERIFLNLSAKRFLKSVHKGKGFLTEVQPGEYEAFLIASPIDGDEDPWWIINYDGSSILGNKVMTWEAWLDKVPHLLQKRIAPL